LKDTIKRLVANTPLDPIARRIWQSMHGRSSPVVDKDDALGFEIIAKVLRPESNCVDVGASGGKFLIHFQRHAPRGHHVAFEPIPEAAKALQRRFPNVRVYDIALSDSTGETEFNYVVSNPGYSGLRPRSYPRPDERIDRLKVKTERLDQVLEASRKIDFIKVDVEGAELQVFRGAIQTLKTYRPFVLFEHGRGAADYYGTTPEMIYDLLAGECGLHISLLGGWLHGDKPLSRDEFVAQFQGLSWNFLAHA